jgi:hypothetical protein
VNPKYDVIILGAGRCRPDVCHRSRQARTPRPGARTRGANRQEDPDLRRRPLQFHQPAHQPGEFSFGQSGTLPSRRSPATLRPTSYASSKSIGIPYHEKKLGQLFCDRAASDITAMLEQECRDAGVEIRCNTKVHEVGTHRLRCLITMTSSPCKPRTSSQFSFTTRLVVATGGLSIRENRRHFIWLRSGPPIWPEDRAPTRRPGSSHLQRTATASAGAIWRESPSRWLLPRAAQSAARNQRFAKTCFSLITASAVPRFSRSRLTGTARSRFISTLLPTTISPPNCEGMSHRDQSSWKLLLREVLPRRFADRWLETYPLAGNSDRALRRNRTATACLGGSAGRNRGLRESGSHGRWCRYRRTFF